MFSPKALIFFFTAIYDKMLCRKKFYL